ncbi:hypothetical protein [Devosia sp. RR2S18]|uniref:hypothetical protein n=1 Tax=Devosia rhizosphaerae TaxID=3049774 RepID=UPI00253FA821|nr:hypothetical protein [Devosia sp. RR2S18]WIJ26925.1 hypothetical protein QOV41_09325 [Devosia sp. RR2S18]
MNRLLIFIVVALFGLISLSGPTMAISAATGQFWTVADQDVCAEADALFQKAPAFRPCPKKVKGHAIPCQQPTCVLPLPVGCTFEPQVATFTKLDAIGVAGLANEGRFRPPQAT